MDAALEIDTAVYYLVVSIIVGLIVTVACIYITEKVIK